MKKIAAIFSLVLLLAACSAPAPTPAPTPLPFVQDDGVTLYFPFVSTEPWPRCPSGIEEDRVGIAWFARNHREWPEELEKLCGKWWYASNANISQVSAYPNRWAMVHCINDLHRLSPDTDALLFEGKIVVGNEPNDAPGWTQCQATSDQMGQLLYDVYQRAPKAKALFPGIIVQYESGNNFSPDYIVGALNAAAVHMGRQGVINYIDAVAIHVYGRYDVSVDTRVRWTRAALDNSGWGQLDIAVTEMGVLAGNPPRQTFSDLINSCLLSEAKYCMGYTNRYPQVSCSFIAHGTSDDLTECGYGWFDGLALYYGQDS